MKESHWSAEFLAWYYQNSIFKSKDDGKIIYYLHNGDLKLSFSNRHTDQEMINKAADLSKDFSNLKLERIEKGVRIVLYPTAEVRKMRSKEQKGLDRLNRCQDAFIHCPIER
jgi:hypothetical protein